MQKRVAILGGGVAGLSAAHELALRGFKVTVYELHAHLGGKARSFLLHKPKARSGGVSLSQRRDSISSKFGNPEVLYQTAGGRRPLPGEHGFRFFAGFYKHLPDTMSNIPFGDQRNGVLGNLVEAPRLEAACKNGPPIVMPTHFPQSPADLRTVLGVFSRFIDSSRPMNSYIFFHACCSWRAVAIDAEWRNSSRLDGGILSGLVTARRLTSVTWH